MVRAYISALFDAVCIALSIGLVIALAAIGCDVRRNGISSHDVKGFRASSALVSSPNDSH